MDNKVDKVAAQKWMEETWKGNKHCPICVTSTWSIADDFLEVRSWHGGNLVMGGATYPHLALICANCGYTIFMNAVRAGLIEPSDPKAQGKEAAKEKATAPNNE
jgi:hypothetical protein